MNGFNNDWGGGWRKQRRAFGGSREELLEAS